MATPKWYANGLMLALGGSIDLDTDTIKLILLTSAYTPAQGTHDFRDDLGANEATGGSGYPAGGFTLLTKTLAVATLTVNWDAADLSGSRSREHGPGPLRAAGDDPADAASAGARGSRRRCRR
jgi:hypothetical protein